MEETPVVKKRKQYDNPSGNGRKKVDGFQVQKTFRETYDVELKPNTTFPCKVDRDQIIRFQFPISPRMYIDLKNSSLAATFYILHEDQTPIKAGEEVTCITEPLLNVFRRTNWYSLGRSIFSNNNYNWHNYINKLCLDQGVLMSSYNGMTGYGLDSEPFNDPTTPGSQQKYRMGKLMFTNPWRLRGPINVPQFGTWNDDPQLLPSTIGLTVEFEMESSDFCVFRKKVAKPQGYHLWVTDMMLYANIKVLADEIPRSRFSKVMIPFHDEKAFVFQAPANGLSCSSGQFSMENNPTRAVIFMVKESADSQEQNPFELSRQTASEVSLNVNGEEFTHKMGFDNIDVYYDCFRTLWNGKTVGSFSLERDDIAKGYFICAFNLSKSGNFDLTTLDTAAPKSPCVVSVSVKFQEAIPSSLQIYSIFYSTGRTSIDTATNNVDIELF